MMRMVVLCLLIAVAIAAPTNSHKARDIKKISHDINVLEESLHAPSREITDNISAMKKDVQRLSHSKSVSEQHHLKSALKLRTEALRAELHAKKADASLEAEEESDAVNLRHLEEEEEAASVIQKDITSVENLVNSRNFPNAPDMILNLAQLRSDAKEYPTAEPAKKAHLKEAMKLRMSALKLQFSEQKPVAPAKLEEESEDESEAEEPALEEEEEEQSNEAEEPALEEEAEEPALEEEEEEVDAEPQLEEEEEEEVSNEAEAGDEPELEESDKEDDDEKKNAEEKKIAKISAGIDRLASVVPQSNKKAMRMIRNMKNKIASFEADGDMTKSELSAELKTQIKKLKALAF